MKNKEGKEYWNRMAEKSLTNTYDSSAPQHYSRKLRGSFVRSPKSAFDGVWSQERIDKSIASIRSKFRDGQITRAEYASRMDQIKKIRNRL